MKKIRKTTLLLLLILSVGAILRFYRLGDVPFGFHRDEAFLGYNAYSILLTGKDINGNFLPLHLKSFLYSPALYSYFSTPFIFLFGLSVFSVRFASFLFGSLTIFMTYLLVKELIKKESLALFASFLLAVSPWHINLSRTATENTIVVFFISLGVFLYLKSLRKNNMWILLFSFASFFIALFLYQAPRVFLPFFMPLLFFLYLPNRKKMILSCYAFFSIICLILIFIFLSKDLSLRIRTVSIFSTQGSQIVLEDQIRTDGVMGAPFILTRLFHNKVIIYTQQFLKNYFSHYSYQFLFSEDGLPDRYRIPFVGLLYIVEFPLLLFGVFKLLTTHRRLAIFLLGWVVLAPLGSALAFDDVPNLQRVLITFPALSITESFGLFYLLLFFRRKRWLKIAVSFFVVAFIYGIGFYLHQYYVHAILYRPWYRQDGYRELVAEVSSLLPTYRKAVITDRESAPTIFFLFYTKYSPYRFQQETKGTKMKDFDRISFGQYEFSQEECPLRLIEKNGKMVAMGEKDVLYVDSGLCKIPHNAKVFSTIKRLDNSLAFFVLAPF